VCGTGWGARGGGGGAWGGGGHWCVALVPAIVLLLDEASNHLDAATLEVLTGVWGRGGGVGVVFWGTGGGGRCIGAAFE
jgi:hypothetical protein